MTERLSLCECGCGGRVAKPGNRFINGHNPRNEDYHERQIRKLCKCGCGELAKPGNDYINGHAWRGKKHTDNARMNISKSHLIEKEPLVNGWEIKEGKMTTNKNCATYLGCHIAEQILSKIFKNVQVMPLENVGYDFICNKDKKIDVKSSATGDDRGYWEFTIRRNQIADYFLCIAFDNRDDLNPVHLWLIPGEIVNCVGGIKIYKTILHKWSQYEQLLDKVLLCCNEMRQPKGL